MYYDIKNYTYVLAESEVYVAKKIILRKSERNNYVEEYILVNITTYINNTKFQANVTLIIVQKHTNLSSLVSVHHPGRSILVC